MKQALILGLAFAANAMTADQVDNELIVAPTGGKLGDIAKLPTKLGKVMFDEQADEELFVAPQGKLAELAKKYPGMIMFDEQADDELMVKLLPREHFQTEEEYKKYLAKMQFHRDDADNELMVTFLSRDSFKTEEEYQKYIAKMHLVRDDADDELLIRPTVQADDDEFIAMLLPREHFKTEEEYQKYVAKMRFHRDDADNELRAIDNLPRDEFGRVVRPPYARFDEQADDELLIRPIVQADDDEFILALLPRENFKTEEEYQKYVAKMRFHRDDEELFVAPEGRLGDLAKRYPGRIMFDEADDELVQTFYSPSGADLVKYAKQSQQTVYRPTAHVVRDDADDEFVQTFYSPSGADLVKYAKQSQQTVYRPTAHVVRDDADDEFAAFPSHPSGADLVRNAAWGRSQPIHTPPKHTNPTYWSKNDDAADDEFVQTFYSPSGADLVKYAKQSQQTVYRPTAHVVRDDADDELMVYYTKDSQGNKHYEGGYTVRRDDAADDELRAIDNLPRDEFGRVVRPPYARFDEQADDELVKTFYSPSGADLVKYAKQSQQTVYRPTAHVVRDDELSLIPVHPRVFGEKGLKKPAVVPTSEALIRDDEADDELAYLGQLIRHAENDRIAPLRTFDDDELRVEKPSHVKAQEKAEMKAELPKMKRKLRPTDETAFLA